MGTGGAGNKLRKGQASQAGGCQFPGTALGFRDCP